MDLRVPLFGRRNTDQRPTRIKSDLLEKLREKIDTAKDAVEEWHIKWLEYEDYYSSDKQRANMEPRVLEKYRSDIVVCNHIYAMVESQVSAIRGSLGQWYAVAEDLEQDDYARDLTVWLQSFYVTSGVPLQLEKTLRDLFRTGVGALKCYWDKDANDVAIKSTYPFTVYPDPAADSMDTMEYLALRNVMSVEAAKKAYPKFDDTDFEVAPTEAYDRQDATDKSRLVEIWELYHEWGKRLTVICGDKVLADGPNPTPGNKWPVFLIIHHQTNNQFWGESVVAYMKDLQDYVNAMRTRMAIHYRLTANPVWITEDPGNDLDTTPGTINRMMPGHNTQALVPAPLGPEVPNSIMKAQADLDSISGVSDTMRGARPRNVTSGIGFEVLNQMAQMRQAAIATNIQEVLTAIGQMALEIMQEYYAEMRTMAVWSGGEPRRVQLDPATLRPLANLATPTEEPMEPFPYRVVSQPGGEIPLAPAALMETAFRLRQLGDIDQVALLEACRFPGRDAVIERMLQEQAAAEQGQMQAEGMLAGDAGYQDAFGGDMGGGGMMGSSGMGDDMMGLMGGGAGGGGSMQQMPF